MCTALSVNARAGRLWFLVRGSRRLLLKGAVQRACQLKLCSTTTYLERLVGRGPDMFMSPADEETARSQALEDEIHAAVDVGLPLENMNQLKGVLSRRWNAFRIALRGGPPARAESLRFTLEPGARAVKAHTRTYFMAKTSWIVACTATRVALCGVPELVSHMGQRSHDEVKKGRVPFGQRLSRRQRADEKDAHHDAEPGGDYSEASRGEVLWGARHTPGILAVPSGRGDPRYL